MIKHTLTKKDIATLDRLNVRFNEVRAELHRLDQREFIRAYQTGPRQLLRAKP